MNPVDVLRDGIRALLQTHPAVSKLDDEGVRKADTVYMERYAYRSDRGIGHEAHLTTKQNLWVHRDAVQLDALQDIENEIKPGYEKGEAPGRNSNLEQIPGFKYAPLIRFSPKTIWEAARIIHAAAGEGGAP
jgi:hypothetical protein